MIYAQRPVILLGIGDFVLRGDLRDRSVFLNMTAIPDDIRRTERMKYAGDRLGPNWPKTVHAFGRELRRIAPQLRVHGISITFERKKKQGRHIA